MLLCTHMISLNIDGGGSAPVGPSVATPLVKPHHTCRISLLFILVLGSASDSCNNKDIQVKVGFNYNLSDDLIQLVN